jgi:hypothetical protein
MVPLLSFVMLVGKFKYSLRLFVVGEKLLESLGAEKTMALTESINKILPFESTDRSEKNP